MPGEGQNLSPWQQMRLNAMYMQQVQAQQQARRNAGQFLYDQYGGQGGQGAQPQMPPAIPQVPQQGAPAPGAMSPGGGNPALQQQQQPPQQQPPRGPFGPSMQPGMPMGGGGMPPPPMAQPGGAQPQGGMVRTGQGGIPNLAQQAGMQQQRPPLPPFKPMPTAPAMASNDTQGGVPPPPAAPAPASGDTSGQRPFNLKGIVQGLKSSGVAPAKVMDMLDALSPAMTAENKQELDMFKAQNAALKAANEVYMKTLALGLKGREVTVKEGAEARRTDQGNQNLQIKRDKENRLKAAASGALGGGVKTSEVVYPKGPDGRPDETKEPLGTRNITRGGKIAFVDREGKQVNSLDGGTAKEAKDTKGQQNAATRNKLVSGSAQNALRMLAEIKTKYPKDTTSILMTTHPEGLIESGLTGVIRGSQGARQQNVDTAWKSFIDEAIPVFTGGLRGSDAFRRFLTSQVPLMGAKNNDEIMRLFENNIKGIDRTFSSKMLSAYASDPKYWGPGVTKEQVDAAVAESQGGAPAAPQQEWKVEKVGG